MGKKDHRENFSQQNAEKTKTLPVGPMITALSKLIIK
jgi:hypothetical protein